MWDHCFLFWVFFFNFRNHIYNAGLKHLRMLHCFGFFFFSIYFIFFLPNYCNSTMCKTNALSPYHESVRSQRPGCRDRERADRAKSLLRAGGEQGGGSGGGFSLLSPSVRRLSVGRSPGPGTREPHAVRGEAFWSLTRHVAPSILGCCGTEVDPGRALWCRYVGGPWGRRRTAACLYQSQTLRTKYEAPVSAWG